MMSCVEHCCFREWIAFFQFSQTTLCSPAKFWVLMTSYLDFLPFPTRLSTLLMTNGASTYRTHVHLITSTPSTRRAHISGQHATNELNCFCAFSPPNNICCFILHRIEWRIFGKIIIIDSTCVCLFFEKAKDESRSRRNRNYGVRFFPIDYFMIFLAIYSHLFDNLQLSMKWFRLLVFPISKTDAKIDCV